MIPVTALSDYLYCPRKVYLRHVMKLLPVVQEPVIKGKIQHDVFDAINKAEENIILNIKPSDLSNISMIYSQVYKELLANSVSKFEEDIKKADLDKERLFDNSLSKFLDEASFRAKALLSMIKTTGLFGKDLIEAIPVKYKSELFMSSKRLKLKGIIDRVEVSGDVHIPVELKTGSMPREGVWPSHKIQIASYVLLLNEQFRSDHGFVEYLDYDVKRKIVMNPFLEDEVKCLVEEVCNVFESSDMPKACDNPNKCKSCNLRDRCLSENVA